MTARLISVDRFHSIKTSPSAFSPNRSVDADDDEIYANMHRRSFELNDTIKEDDDSDESTSDNSSDRVSLYIVARKQITMKIVTIYNFVCHN